MRLPLAVIAMLTALALACGDGDASENAPTPSPSASTAMASATPTATGPASPESGATSVVGHLVVALTVTATNGESHTVTAEVVYTRADRATGLMHREELADDAGMLFLFNSDRQSGFWMENTLIPLDIAYFTASGEIVDIIQGEPLNQTLLVPAAPYRYVLEMNAGWFEARGLGIGNTIAIPDGLPAAE